MPVLTESLPTAGAVLAALVVLKLLFRPKRNAHLRLPPGPPQDPLIGHLRSMPATKIANTYPEWAQKYGKVMHLQLPGVSFIVLSSHDAAVDLFKKRSAKNYFDLQRPPTIRVIRPHTPSTCASAHPTQRQLGLEQHPPLHLLRRPLPAPPPGPQALQTYLTPESSLLKFGDAQTRAARRLAKRMIEEQREDEEYERYLSEFSTTVAVYAMNGHEITSKDDTYTRRRSSKDVH